jgi:hypothetical protein
MSASSSANAATAMRIEMMSMTPVSGPPHNSRVTIGYRVMTIS